MHSLGGAAFQKYLMPAARVYEAATNLVGAITVVKKYLDETAEVVGLTADAIGTTRKWRCSRRPRA